MEFSLIQCSSVTISLINWSLHTLPRGWNAVGAIASTLGDRGQSEPWGHSPACEHRAGARRQVSRVLPVEPWGHREGSLTFSQSPPVAMISLEMAPGLGPIRLPRLSQTPGRSRQSPPWPGLAIMRETALPRWGSLPTPQIGCLKSLLRVMAFTLFCCWHSPAFCILPGAWLWVKLGSPPVRCAGESSAVAEALGGHLSC